MCRTVIQEAWPASPQREAKLRTLANGLSALEGAKHASHEAQVILSWCPSPNRIKKVQQSMIRVVSNDPSVCDESLAIKLGGSLIPPGMRIIPTVNAPLTFFSISDGRADNEDHSQHRLDRIARAATAIAKCRADASVHALLKAELGNCRFELRRALSIKPRRVGDFMSD